MLKLFYPLSRPGDPIYYHNCPVEAVGYYSGTPMGNVDSVPLEGGVNVLPEYKAISFVGYNFATTEDMDTVCDYVTNGGTVVLSWPHMSVTTDRTDITKNHFEIIEHPIVKSLCSSTPIFEQDSVNGIALEVCSNLSDSAKILSSTDAGRPLKAEIALGKGKLILVNVMAYPHHPAVVDVFTDTITEINKALVEKEWAWIECGDDVEFTVYDREDGKRDIYVLAVDWYNPCEKKRSFVLRVGEHKYEMELTFGIMRKITVLGDKAVYLDGEDGEADFVDNKVISVQGSDDMSVKLASDGKINDIPLHFGSEYKLEITI